MVASASLMRAGALHRRIIGLPARALLLGATAALLGPTSPACSGGARDRPVEQAPAAATRSDDQPTAIARAAGRAAWLREVATYVAAPPSIPRLSDPEGARHFEALVSEPAWLSYDPDNLIADVGDALAFFPASKKLSRALHHLNAADEGVLLILYMDRVNAAMRAAGAAIVRQEERTGVPQDGRLAGLERMRVGAAMELCGLLNAIPAASAPIAERALARLADAATYADHSTASLQLLLATIDGPAGAAMRGRLGPVREVIAAAHARAAAASPAAIEYEPLPLPRSLEPQPVVSRGGGFEITVGPGALLWRATRPRGPAYHLEWRDDALLVEVSCQEGATAADFESAFTAMGATPRPGGDAGRLRATRGGDELSIRILSIANRGCVAAAQAPAGTVPAARRDAVVDTLRAAR